MEIVASASLALDATVHALRGNADAARQHAAEALRCVNPNVSRSIVARVRRATGLAAEVEGNYKMAYAQQHLLFAEDGTPLHYHASFLAIADLAASLAEPRSSGITGQVITVDGGIFTTWMPAAPS